MATSAFVIRDVRPELDDARISSELARTLLRESAPGTRAVLALMLAGLTVFTILHLGTGAFVLDLSMGSQALEFPVAAAVPFALAAVAYALRLTRVRRLRASSSATDADVDVAKMRYFWASVVGAVAFGASLGLALPHVPAQWLVALPVTAALWGAAVVAASSAELLFLLTELVLATSAFLTVARLTDREPATPSTVLVVVAEATLAFTGWLLHRAKRARARVDLENRELLADLVTARERASSAEATAEEERALRVEIVARTTMETRTPLNGMLGMTDLLLAGTLRMEERYFAEQARRSSEALLAVLDDIRELARLDTGDVSLDERPFDLEALLEDVVTPLGTIAAKRGLGLVQLRDRSVPRDLVGARDVLHRVLTSLVSTALKRSTTGDVELTVTPASRALVPWSGPSPEERPPSPPAPRGPQLELVVRDFGVATGTPPLGLVLAKHLVQRLGGTLRVERIEPQGTVASFAIALATDDAKARPRLLQGTNVAVLTTSAVRRRQLEGWLGEHGAILEPVDTVAELSQRITDGTRLALVDGNTSMNFDAFAAAMPTLRLIVLDAPKSTVEHHRMRVLSSPLTLSSLERALRGEETADLRSSVVPRPSYGHARVLVVEDEPTDRAVLRGMLGRCGIVPKLAEDGASAIEAMLDERFDLVLVDAELTDVDVVMLVRRIRGREEAEGEDPQVIVALAEHGASSGRARWLDAGMMDVLSKPLTLEAVEATLSRWLPRALFGRAARRFEEKVRPREA